MNDAPTPGVQAPALMEPQLATRDSTPDSDFSSKAQDDEVDPAAKKRVIHKRGGSGPEIQRRPPKDESLDDKRGTRDNRVRGDAKRARSGDAPVKSRSEREAREGSKGDAARTNASSPNKSDRSDRSDRPNPRGGPRNEGREGRRGESREGRRGEARSRDGAPRGHSPGREPEAPPARIGGERNEHGTRVARRIECYRCGAVDHSQWVEQKNDHALCRECAEELLGVLELGRKEKQQTRREVCNLCGVPFDLPTFVKDDGDLLCSGCIRGFMGWKGTLDREYEDRIGDVSESVRPGLRVRRRQGGASAPGTDIDSDGASAAAAEPESAHVDSGGPDESNVVPSAASHDDSSDEPSEVADVLTPAPTEEPT